ncbi:MAG TPA: YihY/virulence factor BrkB family protein [Candidatus Angelobacter sp.]
MPLLRFRNAPRERENAASPWKLGGLTPLQLAKNVYEQCVKDEVLTRSAALSFYFAYALFPMLLFIVAVLGFFARNQALVNTFSYQVSLIMPPAAFNLLRNVMREIAAHATGFKMLLGLGLALWSASTGLSSVMDALNHCYNVEESRPYWKRHLISIALTVALVGLTILSLVIVLYGTYIADFVGERTGLEDATVTAWQIAQWPMALLMVAFAFALIYHWGPDVRRPWRWLTPGSLIGVSLWLAASLAFRTYLHYFNQYSRTYGSLGAGIVLLLWLLLSAMAILIGGEIDAEIAKAAAKRAVGEARRDEKKVA